MAPHQFLRRFLFLALAVAVASATKPVEPHGNFGRGEAQAVALGDAAAQPKQWETTGAELQHVRLRGLKNTDELRALRREVAELRALVTGSGVVAAGAVHAKGGASAPDSAELEFKAVVASSAAAVGAGQSGSGAAAAPAKPCTAERSTVRLSGGDAGVLHPQLESAAACAHTRTIVIAPRSQHADKLASLAATLDRWQAANFVWDLTAEPNWPGHEFVFARNVRPGHAKVLRRAQASQYPASCDKSKIRAIDFAGGYWGMDLDLMAQRLHGYLGSDALFYGITDAFHGYGKHGWQLVDNDWCPDSVAKNKWHCYFLPITPCKLEAADYAKAVTDPDRDLLFSPKNHGGWRKVLNHGHAVPGDPWRDAPFPPAPAKHDMMLSGGRKSDSVLFMRTLFVMLLTRMNYRARARLHARERQFFAAASNKAWKVGDTCVAVHVRRGDKLAPLKGLGVHDPRLQQHKTFVQGFARYMDIARDVLKRLPASTPGAAKNTVFVLTDDAKNLAAHRKDHPDLRIFGIGSDGEPGESKNNPTADTMDLFLSLRLAGRCGGFVGAIGESNISNMAYQFICFLRKECPVLRSVNADDPAGTKRGWRTLGGR